MNAINWRDVALRALKTGVQAGLAILTADALFGDGLSLSLAEEAGVAALAAAYAVVHNALLQWSSS